MRDRGYKNTDELKASRTIAKTFSTIGFDHHIFAHHLIEHVDGAVLKNIYNAFHAIMVGMSERLDNGDIPSMEKMEVALMSKRILDALDEYQGEV